MINPIVRIYKAEQQAHDAVEKLRERGFPEDTIFVVTPASKKDPGSLEAVSRAVAAGFVPQDRAGVYTASVRQGRSLVAIRAPFGHGVLATRILDKFVPVDTGLERREPTVTWDVAAPLSSGFRLPVLWRNQPAPLSNLAGRSTLSRSRTFQSRYAELTSPTWTLSSRLGLRLLSRNQAPRASLSGKAGPSWTRSLGLPLLSRNPAPLSSRLGLHLLTGPLPRNHPAPFSDRLGFPTLSRRRSRLFRMFGELASSNFALFGRSPLSRNAAPLSSLIGKPLLSQEPAPLSSKIGQPPLSDGRELFSSKLGLPLLSPRPAPLSSLLCLPTLSRHQ